MKQIVVASSNKHKIEEIQAILKEVGVEVIAMNDALKEPIEIEETGTSFRENAYIKAKTVSDIINLPVLADDSGLEVRALDYQPGIYSSRYMGEDTSYLIKNQAIIDQLEDKEDRYARFVCALCLVVPGGDTLNIEEYFEGEITKSIQGENGFGYDPIFYYPPLKMTSAEMDSETKNKVSHRGKALARLQERILEVL